MKCYASNLIARCVRQDTAVMSGIHKDSFRAVDRAVHAAAKRLAFVSTVWCAVREFLCGIRGYCPLSDHVDSGLYRDDRVRAIFRSAHCRGLRFAQDVEPRGRHRPTELTWTEWGQTRETTKRPPEKRHEIMCVSSISANGSCTHHVCVWVHIPN